MWYLNTITNMLLFSLFKLDVVSVHFNQKSIKVVNTVLACAFADAIKHVHKDFKKRTCGQ